MLEYKRVLKKGTEGEDVKALQNKLNELGYCLAVDGIFGTATDKAVREYQNINNLDVDGLVGPATIDSLNEARKKLTKSMYYKIGDTYIIETTPDDIEIKILGNTLKAANVYGINGTFFDTLRPTLSNSCWGIASMNGKAIGGNSMLVSYDKLVKRGTIVYYEDGIVEILRINNINEFKKPHVWSISGYSVFPYMNFKEEKMPSGINYRTAHTYIGYKKNKIFLIVKPYHIIEDILQLIKGLKLDGCIVLDGGGSSQLRHVNGSFNASRKINSAVLLKEVL